MPLHWSPKPWPSEAIAAGLLSRRELPLANVWGREPDRISVCEQSSPDLDLLRPHLEPVTLDLPHSIETANEPIRHFSLKADLYRLWLKTALIATPKQE